MTLSGDTCSGISPLSFPTENPFVSPTRGVARGHASRTAGDAVCLLRPDADLAAPVAVVEDDRGAEDAALDPVDECDTERARDREADRDRGWAWAESLAQPSEKRTASFL